MKATAIYCAIAGLALNASWVNPATAGDVSTLERAYLKELTFLKAEKAEMEKRAQDGDTETDRVLKAARHEIEAMSAELIGLRRASEQIEEQLREAAPAPKEKGDSVYDGIDRINELAGREVVAVKREKASTDQALAEALQLTFAEVARELVRGSVTETAAGTFFGADGKQLEGKIVRVGRVAAFGIAEAEAGALAPAGEGALKLFPMPAADAARELVAGRAPSALPMFIVDGFDTQVEQGKETDVTKEVAAAQAGATMKSHGIVDTLMSLPIFEAEWVLYLLMILSVISVGVMVERTLFFRRHRIDVEEVRAELKRHLDRGDFRAAAEYLARFDSLETNVVLFGLREHLTGPDSVEDLLRGAEARERLRYNQWLSFLATVGSNSPFIGLFGTVLGIIRAFGDLAGDAGGAGGSVMAGISEALIATAVGLLVAIPAVIAYNAFMGRVKTVLANSELLSRTLLSTLKSHDVPVKAG